MPDTITAPPAADSGSLPEVQPSTGIQPSNFTRPNSAMEGVKQRLTERWNKKATPRPSLEPSPNDPKPEKTAERAESTPPSEVTPGEETEADPNTTPPEATETDKPATEKPATDPNSKPKKPSPWKLYEEQKKITKDFQTKFEQAAQELEKVRAGKSTEVPKEVAERITAAEARATAAEQRAKEYEDHLRFIDYQKHPEFQDKYAKPYEAAWKRATGELSEVAVTDPATGQTRPATAEDMLALVNLPLGKAREYANQLFGDFADDAMGHRKEIKALFDSQQAALKEARENGATRAKQAQEQSSKAAAEIDTLMRQTWTEEHKKLSADPVHSKYLSPVEGDQKGNAALAKGFEFVDKAWAQDPRRPDLTPEQRKEAVRMHAAMRNRAAAYPRLRQWIEQRDARIAELEKTLEDYAGSEPKTGGENGHTATAATSNGGDFFNRFGDKLKKRAR